MTRKKKKEKNRILKLIYFAVLVLSVGYLLFNNNGAIKYFGLKSEVKTLDNNISKSTKQIKLLKGEIDSLKHSDKKVEEVAREKYNMKKKNEEEFIIKNK